MMPALFLFITIDHANDNPNLPVKPFSFLVNTPFIKTGTNNLDLAPFTYIIFVLHILLTLLMLCGNVQPNPGPAPETSSGLTIVHNNICSLRYKVMFVKAELNSFDIITLSETNLYAEYSNDKLEINGFHPPIRKDREDGQGGGVVIYVKRNLICKHRPDVNVPNLEAV